MQIIEHYKNQISKSFNNLYQQGVLTKQQSQFRPQQNEYPVEQQATSISSKTQTTHTQQQSNKNPYYVSHQQKKLNNLTKCIVCKQKSKYRCPNCLVEYCSSKHFKSHNLFCSQEFYKRQVENSLKNMKSDSKTKSNMRQILKQHNQLIGNQEKELLYQKNQQRMVQLLEIIEKAEKQGKSFNIQQLNLSEQQQRLFSEYINKLQIDIEKQMPIVQPAIKQGTSSLQHQKLLLHQAYWQIPDGLDFYFMQQVQIQQFSCSSHPQLIVFRELCSKKYHDQIVPLQNMIKNPLNQVFKEEIFQYFFAFLLVYRVYNGEFQNKDNCQQAFAIFQNIYSPKLIEQILNHGIQSSQRGLFVLTKIKNNITQLQSKDDIQLITQWYQTVITDAKTILKNKYLVIETFIRLNNIFQNIYQQTSKLLTELKNKKNQKIKSFPTSKQLKNVLNSTIKHIKKVDLILSYLKDQITNSLSTKKQSVLTYYLKSLTIQQINLRKKALDSQKFQQSKMIQQRLQHNGGILLPNF